MEYQEFTLHGTNIPGFNEMINGAMTFGSRRKGIIANSYTAMKKKWITRIQSAVRAAEIEPVETLYLKILWIETNRKRDPDNIATFIKFILDGLQKADVIENDGWAQVKGWENKFIVGDKRGVNVRVYDARTKRSKHCT